MQCLSEKNEKHFDDSRIGSSRAYKRKIVAGKELLNFEDRPPGADTERTIRQLFLTVLNSATVLDMTALENSPNGFFCQMVRIPSLGFLLSAVVIALIQEFPNLS